MSTRQWRSAVTFTVSVFMAALLVAVLGACSTSDDECDDGGWFALAAAAAPASPAPRPAAPAPVRTAPKVDKVPAPVRKTPVAPTPAVQGPAVQAPLPAATPSKTKKPRRHGTDIGLCD
ncbi:hypothetical protein [Streptomyces cinereoruber]|uniref:hypothetical protein n=1 Tax=Streptomyces cinereoruber TaxID=67260 RepID=UPI003639DF68